MTPEELRSFVLTLEGAVESSHQGGPDFRRGGRIVVNLDEDEGTITIKLDTDEQAALVAADPVAYTLPGGWARHGWTTISLDRVPDDDIKELIHQAWDSAAHRR